MNKISQNPLNSISSHFTNEKSKRIYTYIVIFIFSLLAVFTILIILSKWGIGLSLDGVAYTSAARNILNGKGVAVLFDETGTTVLNLWRTSINNPEISVFLWPPLYPVILAIPGLFNMNLVIGATIINMVLFGLNVFLFGFIIHDFTKSFLLSITGSFIILISEVTIGINTYVASEPLFIFLFLTGFLLLSKFLRNRKEKGNYVYLVFSSISFSLALLTRYIGIAFITAGAIVLLFLGREKILKRIANSAIFTIIGFIPMLIWIIKLQAIGEPVRTLALYQISVEDLKNIPVVFAKWITTLNTAWIISLVIVIIGLAVFLFFYFFLYRKKEGKLLELSQNYLNLKLSLIFLISYIVLLFISRLLLAGGFPLAQDRIMSPVFIFFLMAILLEISYLDVLFKKNLFKIIITLIFMTFIAFNIIHTVKWATEIYENGKGFSQEYYIRSKTIQGIRKLPEDTIIYSNAPDLIYYFTKRPAIILPFKENTVTKESNSNFTKDIKIMEEKIKNGKGVIVYFEGITRAYLPSLNDLKTSLHLCLNLNEKFDDGSIYRVCPEPGELIFKTDFTNFLERWITITDCRFEISGEKILVKATGNDPSFFCYLPVKPKKNQPLVLSIKIHSDINSEMFFFYGKKNENFESKYSISYPVLKGENTIYFLIPYMRNLDKIRIDPVDTNSDTAIYDIELFKTKE